MSNKKSADVKSPDAFQTQMYRGFDWALKNKNVIFAAIIPLFIVVVGFWGWQQIGKMNAEDRRNELATIDDIYAAEIEKVEKSNNILNEMIADLSKDEKLLEKNEESIKALEEQVKLSEPNHDASFVSYKDFFKKNSATVEGYRAAVSAANIAIKNKKFEEANELLGAVFSGSPSGAFFNVQVRLVYSNLLEEVGKKEEALAQLDEVYEAAMDSVKPQVLFAKGRILTQLGQHENADTVFTELSQKYASSQEAKKVAAVKFLKKSFYK